MFLLHINRAFHHEFASFKNCCTWFADQKIHFTNRYVFIIMSYSCNREANIFLEFLKRFKCWSKYSLNFWNVAFSKTFKKIFNVWNLLITFYHSKLVTFYWWARVECSLSGFHTTTEHRPCKDGSYVKDRRFQMVFCVPPSTIITKLLNPPH